MTDDTLESKISNLADEIGLAIADLIDKHDVTAVDVLASVALFQSKYKNYLVTVLGEDQRSDLDKMLKSIDDTVSSGLEIIILPSPTTDLTTVH